MPPQDATRPVSYQHQQSFPSRCLQFDAHIATPRQNQGSSRRTWTVRIRQHEVAPDDVADALLTCQPPHAIVQATRPVAEDVLPELATQLFALGTFADSLEHIAAVPLE